MSAMVYPGSAIDDWPTSRLSKITVRCSAAKAWIWGIHTSVSQLRPLTQSSGSPSPWIS